MFKCRDHDILVLSSMIDMTMIRLHLIFSIFFLASLIGCKETPSTPTDEIKDIEEENDEEETATNLPPVDLYGQLSVAGNRIISEEGDTVQLRGMSFFWSQWIGKYYTPEAVKWLKDDWRATVIRAAMAVDHDGYLQNPEAEKVKVKAVVDAAIAEGLYVIIDWHDHEAEKHLETAKDFFGEMASTYGDYPHVIYEPYNEPLDVSWSGVLKPYFRAIIDTIRFHDADNIVVCGSREWSQQVLEAANDPIDDENVAYSLHYYAATHKQWLRDRAKAALDKGIALMVTEYGTCESSGSGFLDEVETKSWWDFMDEHQISHCNWSIADKVETAAALLPGASITGGWEESDLTASGKLVRAHLIGKNPKPE